MQTFTLMTESFGGGGRWKRYAIPAALLAAGGLYYLSRPDNQSENSYHAFKRNANAFLDAGADKAEQLKTTASKAWDNSESVRRDMRSAIDYSIDKAGEGKDYTIKKWNESAPARNEFMNDVKLGYNNHIQPFFDKVFPKS